MEYRVTKVTNVRYPLSDSMKLKVQVVCTSVRPWWAFWRKRETIRVSTVYTSNGLTIFDEAGNRIKNEWEVGHAFGAWLAENPMDLIWK